VERRIVLATPLISANWRAARYESLTQPELASFSPNTQQVDASHAVYSWLGLAIFGFDGIYLHRRVIGEPIGH
jgi:hypothetical protein